MKRDNKLFLEDILVAIHDIETFSQGITFKDFCSDKEKRLAILKSFEIIGEAVKNLEESLTSQYPSIPWARMAAFRDVLTHEYFGIDLEFVWKVIAERLPRLKQEMLQIKNQLNKSP